MSVSVLHLFRHGESHVKSMLVWFKWTLSPPSSPWMFLKDFQGYRKLRVSSVALIWSLCKKAYTSTIIQVQTEKSLDVWITTSMPHLESISSQNSTLPSPTCSRATLFKGGTPILTAGTERMKPWDPWQLGLGLPFTMCACVWEWRCVGFKPRLQETGILCIWLSTALRRWTWWWLCGPVEHCLWTIKSVYVYCSLPSPDSLWDTSSITGTWFHYRDMTQ